MKTRVTSQTGYTFIELMVVMIILGVLGALAFPAYSSMVRRARYAEIKQSMGTIAEEAHMYVIDHGQYPPEVGVGVPPQGIVNWPTESPIEGRYDYDHWNVGGGQCYVQVAFQGDNQQVDYPVNQVNASPQSFAKFADDLVLGVALYDC